MEPEVLFTATILYHGRPASRVELFDGINLIQDVIDAIPTHAEECVSVVILEYKHRTFCNVKLCISTVDLYMIARGSGINDAELLRDWSNQRMLQYREAIPQLDNLINLLG